MSNNEYQQYKREVQSLTEQLVELLKDADIDAACVAAAASLSRLSLQEGRDSVVVIRTVPAVRPQALCGD